MQQEPELIDIFAMFAMHALTANPCDKDETWIDYCDMTAMDAYMMARAMMEERRKYVDE